MPASPDDVVQSNLLFSSQSDAFEWIPLRWCQLLSGGKSKENRRLNEWSQNCLSALSADFYLHAPLISKNKWKKCLPKIVFTPLSVHVFDTTIAKYVEYFCFRLTLLDFYYFHSWAFSISLFWVFHKYPHKALPFFFVGFPYSQVMKGFLRGRAWFGSRQRFHETGSVWLIRKLVKVHQKFNRLRNFQEFHASKNACKSPDSSPWWHNFQPRPIREKRKFYVWSIVKNKSGNILESRPSSINSELHLQCKSLSTKWWKFLDSAARRDKMLSRVRPKLSRNHK